MATGYTAKIKEGQTFNDFVLGCARAFGACIAMRDDPADKPIPDEFKPSDYHANEMKEAAARLQEILHMTHERAVKAAKYANSKNMDEFNRNTAENNDLKEKYESMLALVHAWIPPTKEHEGLKVFMLEQINESKRFDCCEQKPPVEISVDEWVTGQIKETARSLHYHNKEHAEELIKAKERTQWVKDLRQSLQQKQGIE